MMMLRRCGVELEPIKQIRGGTARNEKRETLGWRLAAVAKMMGKPLIPWQRAVADVACEIDPKTGTFFFDTIVISTPRQCGKSALVDASDVFNASLGKNRRVMYSAQTGADAEDHFRDFCDEMKQSKLMQKIDRFRLSNGNMRAFFTNGSTIRPIAMTKVAGHGKQFDKITLDEAFTLTKEQGDTITDAILPTMNTRQKMTGITPQRWITSTEGNSESTWFNPLLDGLRAGNVPERTAWFDFGIPADSDPEDLDNIMRWHPAAGFLWNKPQLKDFRDGFDDNAKGWARAFGNRRDTGIAERVISADLWDSTGCQPIGPSELEGRKVVFGAAVDVDATHTSISVGIIENDGSVSVQLLQILDGTGSAPNEIIRLCQEHKAPLAMDSKGPNADLHDRLSSMTDAFGSPVVEMLPMAQSDFMAVGQAFVSGLENHVIRHAADSGLDDSVANSARTWSGDAWRVSRRGSTGLTSPLESAMLAAWGAAHAPETTDRLEIF